MHSIWGSGRFSLTALRHCESAHSGTPTKREEDLPEGLSDLNVAIEHPIVKTDMQIQDAVTLLDSVLDAVRCPLTTPTHRSQQQRPPRKIVAQPPIESTRARNVHRKPERDTEMLHAHPNSSAPRLIPVANTRHSTNTHQGDTHEGYLAHIETTKLSTFPQGHCGEPTAARLVRTQKTRRPPLRHGKPPSRPRIRPVAADHTPVPRANLLSVN